MISWPRSIAPEDRIHYLVVARGDFKDQAHWNENGHGGLSCVIDDEILEVIGGPDPGFEAHYSLGNASYLIGEFETAKEAKKALIDHVVVTWASRQAWEDVAT